MKKTNIVIGIMLAGSMFIMLAAFQNSKVQALKLTQNEVRELDAAVQKSFTGWKEKHEQKVGAKKPYTAVTLLSRRANGSEAVITVMITSTELKALGNSQYIDITVQPLESNEKDDTLKNAGFATQTRIAKMEAGLSSIKGQIANINLVVSAQSKATFVKVTSRVGDSLDKTFITTMLLSNQLSASTVGASPCPTSDAAQVNSVISQPSKSLTNSLTEANYMPAQCGCQTITVSCSCQGCPGCTTGSKNCRNPPCGTITSSCNPINGTCSLNCTTC